MPVRQEICPKCGKKPKGKVIVVEWGGHGRLCEACQPAKTLLANGQEFVRKTDKHGL